MRKRPTGTRRGGTGSGAHGREGSGAVGHRLRSWLGSPDGRAVAVLVVVPLLFFVVPAAWGHPAITGDNLIQNLPLRALTGRQLREGHLPLWNPYIWSGSPLLGGLNSGSFYPLTFLFVGLAPVAAFIVNLLAVYWAGGLGMYALCRQYRLGPVASVLGALTYAFSGAMSGQIVHLGVVQGMGWMPLLVLAELRMSWAVLGTGPVRGEDGVVPADVSGELGDAARGASRRSPWPWVALLALLVGLEALTGEPRAMVETEVVGVAVAAWLVLRPYARAQVGPAARVRLSCYVVLAGVWGVALAAAELAPGWTFIKASQRAVETFQFFGTGSLRPSWSLLLLVPDLFGGAGHFGSAHYFNAYNLAEVTGYVGLLPLGAALALFVRSFGRRRASRSSDWGVWLALGALGLLLTWGSFTPLGHIWELVPLLGKTRLQSRNVEIVDLALAVLFAFWADRVLAERHRRDTAIAAKGPWSWLARQAWLAAVPAGAAILLCAIILAAPGPVEEWLRVSPAGAALARGLWPWFLAQSLVAGGVIGLVAGWHRLRAVTRRRALVAVVVADLAFFVLATSTAIAPASATLEPTPAAAAAVLGVKGRFAIVDTNVTHLDTLTGIGQPDLNTFTRLQSVQGYGSIVSDSYGAATGTHRLDTLSACALETGTFNPLGLSTLLASPADLVVNVPSRGPVHPPRSTPCPRAPQPGSADRRAFYLGWPVALRSATLVSTTSVSTPSTARGPTPVVGVVAANGGVRWPAETVSRTETGWSVRFAKAETAAGIVVEGPAREIADTSTVQSADGVRWALDGMLQDALDTSSWRFAGTFARTFGIFRRTAPTRPPVWLAGAGPGSSVRQLAAPDWGGATDRVVATRPATVVWSESYLKGWQATLTPAGQAGGAGQPDGAGQAGVSRASRAVTVHRHGLIQSVEVPPGNWILTFHYRPRFLTLGIAASSLAVAGFVALFCVSIAARRRPRRRRRLRLRLRSLTEAPGRRATGSLQGVGDASR